MSSFCFYILVHLCLLLSLAVLTYEILPGVWQDGTLDDATPMLSQCCLMRAVLCRMT